MLKIFINIFFWVFSIALSPVGITAQCTNKNQYFASGERLTYGIYYNWGFIKLKLAEVILWTKTTLYNKKTVLLIQNKSKTYEKYAWIIDAEDYYASYVNPISLRAYKHIQKTVVDGYYTDNEYIFDWENQKVYANIENSKTKRFKDTIPIQSCITDLLTATYYMRIIDYQNLKNNQKIYLPVILDTNVHNVYFKYAGIETIKLNKQARKCFYVIPSIVETSTFKSGETMKVWISTEKNRLPLKMESELWIGKILAVLEKSEGLRYENTP